MRGPSLAALPTSPTCPRTYPTAFLSLHTLSASTCPGSPASLPLHLPFYLDGFALYPGPSQLLPVYMPHLQSFPARGGHQRSTPHSPEGPL